MAARPTTRTAIRCRRKRSRQPSTRMRCCAARLAGRNMMLCRAKKRPEQGILRIRKELGLFANLRPAIMFDELVSASSLKPELIAGLDILILRELTGDIYFGAPRGQRANAHGEREGYDTMLYSEYEIRRIADVGFQQAMKRGRKLTSVDKENVLETSRLWRAVVKEVAKNYPQVELSHLYVDNAAMQLVRNPKQFDVIVTDNLFGDVLSDCAAMLTGSLGMLPSASLGAVDPKTGKRNALYEPIHGSAPDIAGKGVANPIATIMSFAMALRYSFDLPGEAEVLENAVRRVLDQGLRTGDIMQPGKTKVGTREMGEAVLKALEKSAA